jgi:predicted nucleotidyltransferase
MNVSAPILDIVPGPRGLLLNALCRLTGRCTGRQLAAQAEVPTATTARILAEFVEIGLVDAMPVGRAAMLYRLRREHLLAQAVMSLSSVRFDLVDELRSHLKKWPVPATAAWLFGSAARGDGNRESDIDLFLVARDTPATDGWQRQVGELAELVERLTGNDAQVVEHTASSFRELEASKSPIVTALRVDGIELVDSSWAAIATAGRRAG